jgi:hypothetical protein
LRNGRRIEYVECVPEYPKRLINECLSKGYEVTLEADVSGWLFHLFLTQPEINLQQIRLNTRVCNVNRLFFDIAIGPLQIIANRRPCINPQLVVEIKIFPRIGFTNQQCSVHYKHILNDDLPKLGRLDRAIKLRTALIIDGRGYLEGAYKGYNRREYLINRRNEVASGVHVFIVSLSDGKWQIKHEAPETAYSSGCNNLHVQKIQIEGKVEDKNKQFVGKIMSASSFRYHTKKEGYPNLCSDINELGKIHKEKDEGKYEKA